LQQAEHVTTISGFLSSSVKLHGRRTISGTLLVFGFVGMMRLLSNYFDLLLTGWMPFLLTNRQRQSTESMYNVQNKIRQNAYITQHD